MPDTVTEEVLTLNKIELELEYARLLIVSVLSIITMIKSDFIKLLRLWITILVKETWEEVIWMLVSVKVRFEKVESAKVIVETKAWITEDWLYIWVLPSISRDPEITWNKVLFFFIRHQRSKIESRIIFVTLTYESKFWASICEFRGYTCFWKSLILIYTYIPYCW